MDMPSQPLPLPKLSSSMFVPVHREEVPCCLLDSMKNELVSSECTPPSLVAMPCSVFLQHERIQDFSREGANQCV